MPEYLFAYHGGNPPSSPEEGARHMQRWKDWVAAHGDAWVNPGTPVGLSKTVSADGVSDGGGANPINGFAIFRADSLDAALEAAGGSPFLETGGTLEVAELKQMP